MFECLNVCLNLQQVIGCPKTIDGDLKNEYIPVSFGFDTVRFSLISGMILNNKHSKSTADIDRAWVNWDLCIGMFRGLIQRESCYTLLKMQDIHRYIV